MSISVIPCPRHRLDEVVAASHKTDAEHRARQPYAFPENGWEMYLQREYMDAFRDAKGRDIQESGNLFIVEMDGALAGFILLSWWARPDAPETDYGIIQDIRVFDGFRGQGVGDALLAHAQNVAQSRGWHNLTAQVWAGNEPSARLFERAGFTAQSTTYRFGPSSQVADIKSYEPRKSGREFPVFGLWIVVIVVFTLIALFTR